MSLPITIEPDSDKGWAVKRNGTLLIRTASETDWQAMGNGLVLVFNYPPSAVDWAYPAQVGEAWRREVAAGREELEIVACRVAKL